MQDKIIIKNLRLAPVIGVYPEEKVSPQKIEADIILKTDTRRAGRSDELDDTVDYALLCSEITELSKTGSFQLIETLAEHISDICLGKAAVGEVTITIRKPGALPEADYSAVEITRKKEQ